MHPIKNKAHQTGITLFEVLIVMALLVSIIIPIIGTLSNLTQYHTTITHTFQASLLTQQQLETAINIFQSTFDWEQIITSTDSGDSNIITDVIGQPEIENDSRIVTYTITTTPEIGPPYFDSTNVPLSRSLVDSDPDTQDNLITYRTQITLYPVCRDRATMALVPIDLTNTTNPCAEPTNTVDDHSLELIARTEWDEPRSSQVKNVEMRTMIVNLGIE